MMSVNLNICYKSRSSNLTTYILSHTDKRTDFWTRDFIKWKINFGLWAVAWAGQWEKGVWADSEQLFWVFFFNFSWEKNENIVASALKSCIEKR